MAQRHGGQNKISDQERHEMKIRADDDIVHGVRIIVNHAINHPDDVQHLTEQYQLLSRGFQNATIWAGICALMKSMFLNDPTFQAASVEDQQGIIAFQMSVVAMIILSDSLMTTEDENESDNISLNN